MPIGKAAIPATKSSREIFRGVDTLFIRAAPPSCVCGKTKPCIRTQAIGLLWASYTRVTSTVSTLPTPGMAARDCSRRSDPPDASLTTAIARIAFSPNATGCSRRSRRALPSVERTRDRLEVRVGIVGHDSECDGHGSHPRTSRPGERTDGASIRNGLVAASRAPPDLRFAAARAREQCRAFSREDGAARGAAALRADHETRDEVGL